MSPMLSSVPSEAVFAARIGLCERIAVELTDRIDVGLSERIGMYERIGGGGLSDRIGGGGLSDRISAEGPGTS